jgi:hypothetical protein
MSCPSPWNGNTVYTESIGKILAPMTVGRHTPAPPWGGVLRAGVQPGALPGIPAIPAIPAILVIDASTVPEKHLIDDVESAVANRT